MNTESPLNKKVLGVIPARGGSKGVIRKNIRLVGGKPLIAYTIQAAHDSRVLSDYHVSTDDKEIAEIAQSLNCPVIMRPPELAADETPMVPVIEHILCTLESKGFIYDYVVVLQPTTPLRTSDDIDAAVEILFKTAADSVVSVYKVEDHHPSRMYRLTNGMLEAYAAEAPGRLRQNLQPVYHRNGAVYVCKSKLIKEFHTLIGKRVYPYIMSRERSVNIDNELDLAFAEFLMRRQTEEVFSQ